MTAADVGKTIKVAVSLTDDVLNYHTLTSLATAVVSATSPSSPTDLNVSVNDTAKLDLAWNAPVSNGGSTITGYTIQWKEPSDRWDTAQGVSETIVTATSHTVDGLTDGTEYTFRVAATNAAGRSTPSTEAAGTPRETTAPTVSSAAVNGPTLSITFNESLSETAAPATSSFSVAVNQVTRPVKAASISRAVATLTLASAVTHTDQVTVAYTVPTGQSAAPLQDLNQNPTASFTNQNVNNNTPIPLTASTHDVPAYHDGSAMFTFELRFSENVVGLSYKTLRDRAFTVTGGEITKASRPAAPKNVRWAIKVRPSGDDAVTLVLPATTDCSAQNAICLGSKTLSNRLEVTVPGPASQPETADDTREPVNEPPTGQPTISGTARFGQTLTASTANITDADGMTNPGYTYQWIANDGNSDTNIQDATANAYTVAAADVGKTIKVKVTFADDAQNQATLTSTATATVTAAVPGAPTALTVSVNDTQKLDVSWTASTSNGGSAITGYKLQWKQSPDSWNTPADVSETTTTGTTHTVSGLTDGINYTFRVIATNSAGDGAASDETNGTPRETTPPSVSSASVNGTTLTITFSENLATSPLPAANTFTVDAGGDTRAVNDVSISRIQVTLTLASAVSSSDQVTVGYTPPTEQANPRLKDLNGNSAAPFSGKAVTNNTPTSLPALTSSSHDIPSSHDGASKFTFELRFSENVVGLSYKTLRDRAFTVTGGDITKAKRLEARMNIRWEITVAPDGNGAVNLVLPITTDCSTEGAICKDGGKLSNHLDITVNGPGS